MELVYGKTGPWSRNLCEQNNKSLNLQKRSLYQKSHETNQIAPDNVIAGVVEVYVLATSQVDGLVEALFLDAVDLEDCPTSDDNLKSKNKKMC